MKEFFLSQLGIITIWGMLFVSFGILYNFFDWAGYVFLGLSILAVVYIIIGMVHAIYNAIKDEQTPGI